MNKKIVAIWGPDEERCDWEGKSSAMAFVSRAATL